MDEEYDVIVLGTGLTVSRVKPHLRCTETKKKKKKKKMNVRTST